MHAAAMMMEACKCSTEADSGASAKQRQPEQRRGAQTERQRAERDHGRDLFGRQPENGVRAQSDRTAAQRIEPDVVADRVTHEGDQREPRVGHSRTGELEPQGIVQGQAAVSRRREDHSPQELGGLDRPHVLEDVPPPVLAEEVMQPEQRDHEQGDPEQRRPRRDLSNCVRECQARVSYQGCRGAVQGGCHVPRSRQLDVETARVSTTLQTIR